MFTSGNHLELKTSIDSIGASVALFEISANQPIYFVSANYLFEEISGVPVDQMVGMPLSEIFPRYLESKIIEDIKLCTQENLPSEAEYVIDREGLIRWWRFIFSPVISSGGQVKRVLNTCIEITEKKQLELALRTIHNRFEAVIESAYDGIVTIDKNSTIAQINQSALEIFGYRKDEITGKPLERLLPKKYRAKHKDYVAAFAESPVRSRPMHARSAVRGLRKDGTEFTAEVTISKIRVDNELEMTAVVRDISERSRLIEELQKAAIEDGLTGIYNRRHLERIIRRELLRCSRFGCLVALVLFDIDEFKKINDSLGHEAGDLVLKRITGLVKENIREVDVFGRWGGDEFLLILPQSNCASASRWADRLRAKLAECKLDYHGQQIELRCSFGVAEYDIGLESAETLVAMADKALYGAKQAGRNQVCCYTKD